VKLAKLSNYKILLVDDDQEVRAILKEYLINLGGLVAEVDSGKKAFEQIKKHEFDVVISDLRLPNLSGKEYMDLIRSYSGAAPRTILMILFSDISSNEDKEKGKEGFYLKPQKMEDLIELIVNP
jgi:CheY-like chemotaxis protein